MRYECLIYTTVGFVTMSNMFLQNTRKTGRVCLRLIGLNGLAVAQCVLREMKRLNLHTPKKQSG
ncbi:MAG: hypothetical protein IJT58_03640 [Synergistaceae bacterium]|nr:hypothetical protein [Synergistaceae bacterium]